MLCVIVAGGKRGRQYLLNGKHQQRAEHHQQHRRTDRSPVRQTTVELPRREVERQLADRANLISSYFGSVRSFASTLFLCETLGVGVPVAERVLFNGVVLFRIDVFEGSYFCALIACFHRVSTARRLQPPR